MTRDVAISKVLGAAGAALSKSIKKVGLGLAAAGVVGLVLGFAAGADASSGWSAVLVATVVCLGLGSVGPLLSAIFQMTGAKWGRAYVRLAEGSVALMPVGIAGLLAVLAGGGGFLPWALSHPHGGGKAIWLTRGFWDARVLVVTIVVYATGLAYVRWSLRRDFCLEQVRSALGGRLGAFVSKGITSANANEEAARCSRKLASLAPVVAVVYGIAFTLLGIDLIMALEPEWFSTLFGAWYFIGNVFLGLALLIIGSIAFERATGLKEFFSIKRRADAATLLLAFCLINVDFFWNQYLTIWYANLPEETFFAIERTVDASLPWRSLSFVSLCAFFLLPFAALLLRRVKRNGPALVTIAAASSLGVLLARFLEIAPALMRVEPGSGVGSLALPLASALLVFAGFLGAGLTLFAKWVGAVPMMPLGDEVFVEGLEDEGGAP